MANEAPGNAISDEVEIRPGESFDAPAGTGVEVQLEPQEVKESDTAFRIAPPHCIYAYKSKGAIQVQNDCPDGYRVTVKIKFAPATGCKWIEPGTRANVGLRPGAAIDRLEFC